MLKDQLIDHQKQAMKAGDKPRLATIRLILAAVKQLEVDSRKELTDDDVIQILTKMVKQRRDSITQFTDGGRKDLADAERAEIVVLEDYLPEPLADDELDALIDRAIAETGAAGMRDMGKVMGLVKDRVQGRADMGTVSGRVKSRLSA